MDPILLVQAFLMFVLVVLAVPLLVAAVHVEGRRARQVPPLHITFTETKSLMINNVTWQLENNQELTVTITFL